MTAMMKLPDGTSQVSGGFLILYQWSTRKMMKMMKLREVFPIQNTHIPTRIREGEYWDDGRHVCLFYRNRAGPSFIIFIMLSVTYGKDQLIYAAIVTGIHHWTIIGAAPLGQTTLRGFTRLGGFNGQGRQWRSY